MNTILMLLIIVGLSTYLLKKMTEVFKTFIAIIVAIFLLCI